MLTYLGTQRTVKSVNGASTNTFKYGSAATVYPSAGSIAQAALSEGVVGNYSPDAYNSTQCYFQSRGASALYTDAMTAMTIDMSSMLGISPQTLLEEANLNGKMEFSADGFRSFNLLRDPGNQIGVVTTVDNKYSLQARQIRS